MYTKAFELYTKELSKSKYDPLSKDEEEKLVKQYMSGSTEAFDKLVNSHLRFVVYSLRNYTIPPTLDIMDLIQEGNCGLIEGLKRFDYNKYKCRVFSFCYWWIRFYLTKMFLDYGDYGKFNGVFKFTQKPYYCNTCNINFSEKDLKLHEEHNYFRRKKIQILTFSSLEEDENSDSFISTYLNNIQDMESILIDDVVEDIIGYLKKKLTPREVAIVTYLLGLAPPYIPMTLEQVGSMLNLNLERVRQLKEIIFEKLRELGKDNLINRV